MRINTMIQFKKGNIVKINNEIYVVDSSLDLKWLKLGEGFLTTLTHRPDLNIKYLEV
jgi:translation elongation factor P/translation initiation factor 5A